MSTATSWPTKEVDVDVDPRVVIVPPDLAAALNRDVGARKFFDGLTYSSKRWHVLSIEGAKTSESRRRRIGKSVTMLRGGRAR
jgi:uncharacterized protein YdeI (YjbR/CyaY-like superfamily)